MKQTLINAAFLASGAAAILLLFVGATLDNWLVSMAGLPLAMACAYLSSDATVGKEEA